MATQENKQGEYKVLYDQCRYIVTRYNATDVKDIRTRLLCCLSLLDRCIKLHRMLVDEATELDRTGSQINDSQCHDRIVKYRSKETTYRNHSIGTTHHQGYDQLACKIIKHRVDIEWYNTRYAAVLMVFQDMVKIRSEILAEKCRNKQHRVILNLLLASIPVVKYNGSKVFVPSLVGMVCGKYAADWYGNWSKIRLLIKCVPHKRGGKGRQSVRDGQQLCSRMHTNLSHDGYERYTGTRTRSYRIGTVALYVLRSKRYRNCVSWWANRNNPYSWNIDLRFGQQHIEYRSVDKLNRLTAANSQPSVDTIFTGRPITTGIEFNVSDTTVTLYKCSAVYTQFGTHYTGSVYYLGKTGSAVIDNVLLKVDWFHINDMVEHSRLTNIFSERIGRAHNIPTTDKSRRLEIAAYARKLVRLERISMMDSKSAGNCLPGTLQFCRQLGVTVSSDWSDTYCDARELLRKWKDKEYHTSGGLFYAAIDAAHTALITSTKRLTVYY